MVKRIVEFVVLENRQLTDDLSILEIRSPEPLPEMRPGQFVQIRIDGNQDTFLRRPFSIHDADYGKRSIRLLVQVVGSGSRKLYSLKKGDNLNIVYPLGNSFSDPAEGEKVLLVGGGSGIAPIWFLAKRLHSIGFRPDILLGFRNKSRIIEIDDFRNTGEVYITTEDGSEGEKGYVTSHSVLNKNKYDRIFCCGPDGMMKAVAKYAAGKNTECEVSLENLMGCGFGICLCCIVSTNKGNLCTCTDGPVFNIKELKW